MSSKESRLRISTVVHAKRGMGHRSKLFGTAASLKRTSRAKISLLLLMCVLSWPALAQTNLAPVNVTAPAYLSHHGGYLISGDFKVDPRIPSVVFPSQALVAEDILSIEPVHLADDEYLVLQECATADCSQASIVRVWNAEGATTAVRNSEDRILIQHENKYFIWLKRFPEASNTGCATCGDHYTSFEPFSPPMMLIPSGALAAYNKEALSVAEIENPVSIKTQVHEGSTFVVTYEGGSTVRIRRMHADH